MNLGPFIVLEFLMICLVGIVVSSTVQDTVEKVEVIIEEHQDAKV